MRRTFFGPSSIVQRIISQQSAAGDFQAAARAALGYREYYSSTLLVAGVILMSDVARKRFKR